MFMKVKFSKKMSRFWIMNSLSDITFKILDGYKKPY